ncbi:class I SAM-dependent methyltransferase [Myxococcota bacterium]|nr:class I SAM-dependent methyltransferase [Myxococcota bacterium]
MVETQSKRQKEHYERIHDEYTSHYYDDESLAYRRQYILEPMFEGLNLDGKKVADLMCGNGLNSMEVMRLFPGAEVSGFDISSLACDAYRESLKRPAYELDLTQEMEPVDLFDVVMVIGGLHHCVTDIPRTLENVAKMLKPDGLFLMMEPNANYVLEPIRTVWYQRDAFFDAETEHALKHDSILELAAPHFALSDVNYFGGPAYFLVQQSLIFRLPKRIKTLITPPLLLIERFFNRLPGRMSFAYFVARWRRVDERP